MSKPETFCGVCGGRNNMGYHSCDPKMAGNEKQREHACGLGDGTHFACDCTLKRLRELEAQVQRYKEREEHYVRALRVSDGGMYREDWDAAISRVVRERDAAKERLAQIRTYGFTISCRSEAICAIIGNQLLELTK